jgi:phosphoribosylglycinamide formyltransferase-1
MSHALRLGVLASGTGSNLQAIIDASEAGRLGAEIRIVISNVESAGALARARTHALPTATIDHRDWPTREAYDAQLVDRLRACDVELVVLAGFNRLLSPVFVRAFPMRIINIHPALLPSFPGLHAQRQAVDYGVRIAGATVHFVDEQTDHGPIIIQAAVPAYPDDTEDTLQARILEQEHRIYPEAIRLLAQDNIRIEGRRITAVGATADPARGLVNPRIEE